MTCVCVYTGMRLCVCTLKQVYYTVKLYTGLKILNIIWLLFVNILTTNRASQASVCALGKYTYDVK